MTIPLVAMVLPSCTSDCPEGSVERGEGCFTPTRSGPEGDASSGGETSGGTGGISITGSGGATGGTASSGGGAPGNGGTVSSGGTDATGGVVTDGGEPDAGMTDSPPCPPGQVTSGVDCVEERIYVDAGVGDDENPGTLERPLRSFRAAMLKARSNQRVVFAPGTWSLAATQDTFEEPIPSGVVAGKELLGGEVLFDGGGVATLSLEGTAKLSGVTVQSFSVPFDLSTGSPEIIDTVFKKSSKPARLSGEARLRCLRCTFTEGPASGEGLLIAEDASQLRLDAAKVEALETSLSGAFAFLEEATLVATDTLFKGAIQYSIIGSGPVSVTLRNVGFETLVFYDMAIGPDAKGVSAKLVDMDKAEFARGIQLNGDIETVRVRNSTFVFVAINGDRGTYDFGTPPDSPGGNAFDATSFSPSSHLLVTGAGNVVTAFGNTFRAGVQEADGAGKYPPGTIITDANSGANITVISPQGDGGVTPSRVEL